MSIDVGSAPAATAASGPGGFWRGLLTWSQALEAAMDTSYDDIQDRRILALEREVASLREILNRGPLPVLGATSSTAAPRT